MKYKVLLYYHFAPIKDAEEFARQHRAYCLAHGILGRILVSPQGLNGTCAGTVEAMDKYMEFVRHIPGFKKTWFKENLVDKIPFTKIFVRPKTELVAFNDIPINPQHGGKHISPTKLNNLIKEKGDDLIIIDMRNEIEYRVGHFKNAISTPVKHFRDLPQVMDQFKDVKNKTVVMYCTGGIRCEIASPYFKKNGFDEVYQLDGGIYNYCTQFPNKYFEGDCFVFDERMSVHFLPGGPVTWDKAPEESIISTCDFCSEKSNRIVNDERGGRHTLVVCCESCDEALSVSVLPAPNTIAQ
jgi:UPF0176 protein